MLLLHNKCNANSNPFGVLLPTIAFIRIFITTKKAQNSAVSQLKVTIIALIILISGLSFGQMKKFEIGIQGGPNLTDLRGNGIIEEQNDVAFRFSAGLTFQYNLPRLISFETSIAFERKGVTANFPITNITGEVIGNVTYNTHFDYIVVPLLARISWGGNFKFFMVLGPYFGYLTSQTNVVEPFGSYPRTVSDNTENIKRFDWGITDGLGVDLLIKNMMVVSLEIRSNFGLYNTSKSAVYYNGTIKNTSFNLLLGVAYLLGTRDAE